MIKTATEKKPYICIYEMDETGNYVLTQKIDVEGTIIKGDIPGWIAIINTVYPPTVRKINASNTFFTVEML